jgi:hypothetical protein
MAKDKIKTGKPKSLMGDEVSRQREYQEYQSLQSGINLDPTNQGELNKAKARFLNKLSDLMEDLPDSDLGKAIHQQLTKDIRT